jgi:hypothetical protein
MMGLAWKSLEARIERDPEFRRQMIETYCKALSSPLTNRACVESMHVGVVQIGA